MRWSQAACAATFFTVIYAVSVHNIHWAEKEAELLDIGRVKRDAGYDVWYECQTSNTGNVKP